MKRIHLLLVGGLALISTLTLCSLNTQNPNEPYVLSEADYIQTANTYQQFCSGCHGQNVEAFINREWKFGSEMENIVHSITYGQPDLGMIPYGQVLKEDQIRNLAVFIQSEVKKADGNFTPEPGPTIMKTEEVDFRVDTVVDGLDVPWGLTFLPNGDLLITERKGELYRFSKGEMFGPIAGLPAIIEKGQGGLMDIELHPDYTVNGWIYFTFAKPGPDGNSANTAVGRAKLKNDALYDYEELFVATPWSNRGQHFGSKLAFDGKGHLFFGVGERGNRDENPQTLTNHSGKIHRIHDDGSIPSDNPFVNRPEAMPSIYSYGHRNPQGTVIHPETGEIWESEHGPKGGDEINLIKPGLNYGWPVISYGINYNGTTFTDITEKEGMEQPVHYYVPSIAPCGMTFVTSDRYGGWNNNLLLGSLSFRYLERVVLDEHKVVHTEKLLDGIGRVRNVKVSPDGYVYVAIEKPGKILKLVPMP